MNKEDTVKGICGNKWPRQLPVTWAAAYMGMNLAKFRTIESLSSMVYQLSGNQFVDKEDLDNWLNNKKQNLINQ